MRYWVLISGQAQGPFDLPALLARPSVDRDTKICPEHEIVDWRSIREHSELDFFFRLKEAARGLYVLSRRLRVRLREASKARRETADELELARKRLDEIRALSRFADALRLQDAQEQLTRVREDLAQRDRHVLDLSALAHGLRGQVDELKADVGRLSVDRENARSELEATCARTERAAALEAAAREALESARTKSAQDMRKEREEFRSRLTLLEAQKDDLARALETERSQRLEWEREAHEALGWLKQEHARALDENARKAVESERANVEPLRARVSELERENARWAGGVRALEARAKDAERRLELAQTEQQRLRGDSLRELESSARLEAGARAELEKSLETTRLQAESLQRRIREIHGSALESEARAKLQIDELSERAAALSREKEALIREAERERARRSQVQRLQVETLKELAELREEKEREKAAAAAKAREAADKIEDLKRGLIIKEAQLEKLEARIASAASGESPPRARKTDPPS